MNFGANFGRPLGRAVSCSAAWGALVLVASGCASNLAQMQTARTLEPGQLKVGGGVGWYIPVTQIANIAGGLVVMKRGTATVSRQELLDAIRCEISGAVS